MPNRIRVNPVPPVPPETPDPAPIRTQRVRKAVPLLLSSLDSGYIIISCPNCGQDWIWNRTDALVCPWCRTVHKIAPSKEEDSHDSE